VTGKGIGLHEERTRVTCHLPLNNDQEERAVLRVLDYLKEQRDEPVGVKGFTHSEFRPPSFRGYWWHPKRREWIADRIVLCIVDYKLPLSDPRLSAKVAELKRAIRRCYRESRSPQQEVWVVAQQVIRQD
jgi:hypothetical protein